MRPDLALTGGVLLGSLETCLGASVRLRTEHCSLGDKEHSKSGRRSFSSRGGALEECSDDA